MRIFLLSVAFALLSGCSADIDMTLPTGPEGPAGKEGMSAYELWVEAVENGIIEWDEETDLPGFFRYLKGEKGDAGTDGKSAYSSWKELVAKGIEDPHNLPDLWDKNDTAMVDFFRFLTGKDGDPGTPGIPDSTSIGNNGNWFINGVDTGVPATGESGLSAWQLWVEDVQDENGLKDPHKDDDTLWPEDEVDLEDFWRYLRGDDGTSVTIPVVDPGESSPDVVLVQGKINVVAQFYNQAYSEYVRTSDGSVVYQVLDGTTGTPVAHASVTGLPGPGMSGKSFITDGNGYFTVLKEELPTSGTNEERFGTTTVTYDNGSGPVAVESAEITYVPQRIHVKIDIVNKTESNVKIDGSTNTVAYQGGVYMRVPITVYRKTADYADWETIPSYLVGDIVQNVHAYECAADDPADTSKILYSTACNITVPHTIGVRRPTKRWPAMKVSHQSANYNLWDENDHYFTMVLDSYYGETPHAPAVIKVAPVQFHPLPTAITVNTYAPGGYYGQVTWTGGSFDTSAIDQNLMFDGTYGKTDHTAETPSYTLYTPVVSNYSEYAGREMFHIVFQAPSGGSTQINIGTSSVENPVYAQPNHSVYINSLVFLKSSSLQLISPGYGDPEGVIGTLRSNDAHDQFWIEADPNNYEFEKIDIIYSQP